LTVRGDASPLPFKKAEMNSAAGWPIKRARDRHRMAETPLRRLGERANGGRVEPGSALAERAWISYVTGDLV